MQTVIRPNQDFRGYAGQLVSGIVRPNHTEIALPSLQLAVVNHLFLHSQAMPEVFPPLSVALSLSTHVDSGRGDMLTDPERIPAMSKRVLANLIWMSRSPLRVKSPYLIKYTTQTLCGYVTRVCHRTDLGSFEQQELNTLQVNDIGTVELETHKPMFCDPYTLNRTTGSFIVIDPVDYNTVAGGMILDTFVSRNGERNLGPTEIVQSTATRSAHVGLTVWFTGLSGSGKTTTCRSVYTELLARGIRAEFIDADELRKHFNSDLGFSKEDRDENVRRIAFVAGLLTRNGIVALVAAISPYRSTREEARRTIENFIEVYVDASLAVCEDRDPKGLYKRARAGQIQGFTGIDDPYEPPLTPAVQCDTEHQSIRANTDKVLSAILEFLRTAT